MINTLFYTTQRPLLLMTICLSVVFFMYSEPVATQPLTSLKKIVYKKYCNSSMSEAMHSICGGRYSSLGRKFLENVESGSGYRYPIPNNQLIAEGTIIYRPLQSKMGPIHECCMRPCGYSELKTFCAPDK